MLIEFRTYRIKDGETKNFMNWFENKSMPLMQQLNMHIIDYKFDGNDFIWIRLFQDSDEQKQQYQAFFESEEWINNLKDEAYSMIDSIKVRLFSLDNTQRAIDVNTVSGKFLEEFIPPGRKV
tara:strand:+ start:21296 stop:21661 length:366 start_codon:yes stop_codon:yes gene_type:complete